MEGDEWEYQVRHRAYELWNAAGRPDGKHLQFWEAAEQELKTSHVADVTDDQGADILDARPYDSPRNKK